MTPYDTFAPLALKHTGGRYYSDLDWEAFNGCNCNKFFFRFFVLKNFSFKIRGRAEHDKRDLWLRHWHLDV